GTARLYRLCGERLSPGGAAVRYARKGLMQGEWQAPCGEEEQAVGASGEQETAADEPPRARREEASRQEALTRTTRQRQPRCVRHRGTGRSRPACWSFSRQSLDPCFSSPRERSACPPA